MQKGDTLMKKLSMVLLSAMMFFGLVGCKTSDPKKTEEAYLSDVKATDIKLSDTKNLVEASQYQIQSMDYVTTALAEDHEYNANFVDGLLENDQYGNIVPCLATSYEVSDDGLTYTFHLREGVKWVTNTGEEYATLTADDFVTGLRHGAEFNSGTGWLLEGVIEGYTEYFEGEDYSDEAWAKVGIEAVDDLTVAGVTRTWFLDFIIIPSTPKASALRIIAPKFAGSFTSSINKIIGLSLFLAHLIISSRLEY